MADKNSLQIENVNLRESVWTILTHNCELLAQLHLLMFGEDQVHKDLLKLSAD